LAFGQGRKRDAKKDFQKKHPFLKNKKAKEYFFPKKVFLASWRLGAEKWFSGVMCTKSG
jgi:hypothetical protein